LPPEPIGSMSARPTCAATNRPHAAPVSASPVRSRMCADLPMAGWLFQGSLRLIIGLDINSNRRTDDNISRIAPPVPAYHPEKIHLPHSLLRFRQRAGRP